MGEGYILTKKTLKDHIEAITMPSWKYILNYESLSISTDDLVDEVLVLHGDEDRMGGGLEITLPPAVAALKGMLIK